MLLSVITINYNNCEGLRRTMESVISQTCFDHIEYIVIDDGSNDGSVDEIHLHSSKLSFWTTRPNKGIYATMNEGVSHVTSEYCVFLNSGDVYHSDDCLAKILPELGSTDYVIGRLRYLNTGELTQIGQELTFKYFYSSCIPQNASFVRTSLLRKYPFDEKYRIVSDVKFFIESLIFGDASYKYVDVHVSDYDCNGISSRNRDYCQLERERVYRELLPSRVLQDYFNFTKGGGYKDTPYDKFYVKLRDYKYGRILYSLNNASMRVVSLFRKGARFVRGFPLVLK